MYDKLKERLKSFIKEKNIPIDEEKIDKMVEFSKH